MSEGGAYKAPQSCCCLYEHEHLHIPINRKLCLMEYTPEMYQGGL